MATTHLSSYENLKEIFSRLNTKLLNFFAKRSIYGDTKILMQKNNYNDGDNFIFNWYRRNPEPGEGVYTVDPSRLLRNVVVGFNNGFVNQDYVCKDNSIIGSGNIMENTCNNTSVYGIGNYMQCTNLSNIFGNINYINFNMQEGVSDLAGVNENVYLFGNDNSLSSNVHYAYDRVYLLGYYNNWNVTRNNIIPSHDVSSALVPRIIHSSCLGYSNLIDLSSDDYNDTSSERDRHFELSNIHMFGHTNHYESNNSSHNLKDNEGNIAIVGDNNYVYNSKNIGCYGSNITIGNNESSSINNIFYDIYAYGKGINISYKDNPINSFHNMFIYGNNFGISVGTCGAEHVYSLGRDNKIDTYYCQSSELTDIYQFGHGLINNYNSQISLGIYNSNSADNLFEFGNGTGPYQNQRHNVAVITRSGDLILNDGDVINEDGESLTTLRTDIDLLDGRVETLEGKVEGLEDAVDNIEDDVEALGTRVGNNETDIETLQGQVRDLTLALADALARITELENEVFNEKTNHVQLYTEDGDIRITEDGDNKFTEEVINNG